MVSDSIDWDNFTIVFHNMRRGGTMDNYIIIAFSEGDKTLGRYFNTFDDSYHQLKSKEFFNFDKQKEVLSAKIYTSNEFLVISKFDKNFKSIFSKVLIGPWYPDLEPLLRVYYSE